MIYSDPLCHELCLRLSSTGMCGHKQIGIWEISKITVVDSNNNVNHWLMTGAINKAAFLQFLSDSNDRCIYHRDSADVVIRFVAAEVRECTSYHVETNERGVA